MKNIHEYFLEDILKFVDYSKEQQKYAKNLVIGIIKFYNIIQNIKLNLSIKKRSIK